MEAPVYITARQKVETVKPLITGIDSVLDGAADYIRIDVDDGSTDAQ